MNFETPYLTEQIIAYIGNKRKLLSLIYKAMQECEITITPGLKFFDVFAGSGVVSRFAKSLNFEVYTNDWEYYSNIINTAYLTTNESDIKELFESENDFISLLSKINSLPAPAVKEQFITKYYAPKETDINQVNYKTERLFYTRQNALNIDKIRNYIEKNYPLSSKNKNSVKIRNLLLAELIYEAATHNNTSGVFKAFHKEFGGHGKDALKRILSPIELHAPILIDSDYPCHIYQEDANKLVREIKDIDVAYLDPPYNQHQYGSNYFMLNTIAKWDGNAPDLTLDSKGVLKEKAGIRHDWVETRSHYCYKDEAEKSFEDLIQNLNARFILISYSTDGIIPFETMQDICLKKGKVTIITDEYTTYRGGKQSNKRQNTDIEFILCIDTTKKSNKKSIQEINSIFAKKRVALLFKQKYAKSKLKERNFINPNGSIKIKLTDKTLNINSFDYFILTEPGETDNLSIDDLNMLYNLLSPCVCETKEEELSELIKKAKLKNTKSNYFAKMIPSTLKKLASKKNRTAFEKWIFEVRKLKDSNPNVYALIKNKIDDVEHIAKLRWST